MGEAIELKKLKSYKHLNVSNYILDLYLDCFKIDNLDRLEAYFTLIK